MKATCGTPISFATAKASTAPQCGRHLKAATGTVKGSEEKRYRFKCVDRMHYRTKWHESYQAALMEMIETFEKRENA